MENDDPESGIADEFQGATTVFRKGENAEVL